jgi:phosphatidate cytidylyltransferase
MSIRLLLGSCILAAVAGLFVLDHFLGTGLGVSLLVVALGVLGWCELAVMAGVHKRAQGGCWGLFLAGLLGTLYFLALGITFSPQGPIKLPPSLEPILLAAGIAAAVFASFSLVLFREDHTAGFQPLLVTLLGTIFMGLLFSYHLRLYNRQDGMLLSSIYVLGIKGNDIAAYFVGSTMGRVRFLSVSPNKSLEGCIAALVFSSIWFTGTAVLWPGVLFSWPAALGLGILLSVVSQVGDFSESLIKRFYRVKDSAVLLPEFGGILDLVDSFLYSGFVFWLFLEIK